MPQRPCQGGSAGTAAEGGRLAGVDCTHDVFEFGRRAPLRAGEPTWPAAEGVTSQRRWYPAWLLAPAQRFGNGPALANAGIGSLPNEL